LGGLTGRKAAFLKIQKTAAAVIPGPDRQPSGPNRTHLPQRYKACCNSELNAPPPLVTDTEPFTFPSICST